MRALATPTGGPIPTRWRMGVEAAAASTRLRRMAQMMASRRDKKEDSQDWIAKILIQLGLSDLSAIRSSKEK